MINSGIFYGDNVYAYKMSQNSSVDIDSRLDFDLASLLLGGGASSK